MSSTEHFRRFRCMKCGGDAVVATEKTCSGYKCECLCGHIYVSNSIAEAASFEKLQRNHVDIGKGE